MSSSGSRLRRVLLMVRQLTAGGSERQMTETAIGLRQMGFETHVACMQDNGPRAVELRAAGVPILALPMRSYASASAFQSAWMLGRYLRRQQIELVHSFDPPTSCFGVPVARAAGTRRVLSSQRTYRWLVPRYWISATDRMVDGIVVNCEAMRRHLIDDERIRPELIHLCYNAIDTSRFQPGRRDGRPMELRGAELVVGTVCVLRPEKGLSTLVGAFAEVARQNRGLRLLIVGSGPEREKLVRQAAELGVDEQCVFLAETGDVVPWMHQMDIFVLPTLSEALSNSLMEAMACGCCAVATRVGGNGELVTAGETGLLFDAGSMPQLAEHLRALVAEPERRQGMAAAGAVEIAQRFNRKASLTRMASIYTSMLGA